VRLALTYARCVPPRVRRVIEFVVLIKAVFFLATLVYVHTVFATHPATCLDFIKDDWPREGARICINVDDFEHGKLSL